MRTTILITILSVACVSGQNLQMENTLGGLGQQIDNLLRSLLGQQGLNGVTNGVTGQLGGLGQLNSAQGGGLGGLTNGLTGGLGGGSGGPLGGLGGLTGGSGLGGLTGGLTGGNALGGLTGGSGLGGLTGGLTGGNGLLGGLMGRQEQSSGGPQGGDRVVVEWDGRRSSQGSQPQSE